MSLLILDIETVPRPSIDDEVEIEITKKTKVRVEQTGDTVAKAYAEGNIPGVEDYVMRDVEATHQLFEKIKQYISL